MTKKQKQVSDDVVEAVPFPNSARDIDPTLSSCFGCKRIVPCYSYGEKGTTFVFYCVECKPRGDASAPKEF